MKFITLILTIYLLSACSQSPGTNPEENSNNSVDSSTEELIIGGKQVTKKSEIAKTTVSLINTEQGTLCTGSILSDEVVITAAHCADGNPKNMQISFGPKSFGVAVRPVSEYRVSPVWMVRHDQEKNNGDIALIRFTGGVPESFHAVSVMKNSHKLSDGESVTLAGFGISNGVTGAGSGKLRSVDVKIDDAQYSATEVSIDQTKHKGACHGDSGGPAFVQGNDGEILLWGVTSRGINDPLDHCAGDSIYTKISPYTRWINSVTRSWIRSNN